MTKPTKLKPEERLTILNINCRSVNNKIPELHHLSNKLSKFNSVDAQVTLQMYFYWSFY